MIVPAILEKDQSVFHSRLSIAEQFTGVQRIQVDFADGKFAKNVTLSISEIESLNPLFDWEAHLMLANPGKYLDYLLAGFKYIILQFESFADRKGLIEAINEVKTLGMVPCVGLLNDTKVEAVMDLEIENVLLLSVNPGFQGGEFIPRTVDRVRELSKLRPDVIIEVDGGVNKSNIKSLHNVGAKVFVVGSAIFKSGNPKENFESLQNELLVS